MIPTSTISDKQFQRARALARPVSALDARTFVMPSATRPELLKHHRVEFDSPDNPHFYTCTCEAAKFGEACWAAARALDVLVLLAAHGVELPRPGGLPVFTEGPLGRESRPNFDARFYNRREPRAEAEGDPEALLAPPKTQKRVERVRGIQI